MAFSAKDHNLVEKGRTSSYGGSTLDSSHNPGNNMFTYASFFKDINTQKRTPFNVVPSIANNGSSMGKALDFNSTFVEAKDDFSFIIDCAQFIGMVFKEKTLSSCLRAQYPKGLGIRHRMVGKNHKVIELNFPTEEDCMEALQKEFVLQGTTIKVTKALDQNANVVRVGISAIPYKPVDVLKPLLVKTFEQYGDILNVGLCHSKDGDWFTGRGFVTLNMDKSKTYAAELEPQIVFGDFQEKIRLVWSNMQPICTDCHTDDHIKADCPRTRKKACHKCGSFEHLIAACPLAHWNRKKEQPPQERRRRNSGSQETTPTPKPTGREINLLDLMQVSKPKYLGKKKETARDDSSMEISDNESVTSVTSATAVPDAPMPATQETVKSSDTEIIADPSNSSSPNGDKPGETHAAQQFNQTVEPNTEESEYEDYTETGGEDSDHSFTHSFRDRYNLRTVKSKAPSSADATVDVASHKRNQMDSTPTGSDEEGHAKKLSKQHEDNDMQDATQGASSTTNPL